MTTKVDVSSTRGRSPLSRKGAAVGRSASRTKSSDALEHDVSKNNEDGGFDSESTLSRSGTRGLEIGALMNKTKSKMQNFRNIPDDKLIF